MALDGELEKQPDERVSITHIFTNELEAGETLATMTVSVIELSTGDDATAALLITNSLVLDTDRCSYGVRGGVDGEDYQATLTVTTSRTLASGVNVRLQAEHLIKVRER